MENITLTATQIDYLIEKFFMTHIAGGVSHETIRRISRKLLKGESVIVAGERSLWIGGISSFIRYIKDESYEGCMKYELNLPMFLASKWLSHEAKAHRIKLQEEIDRLTHDLESISIF